MSILKMEEIRAMTTEERVDELETLKSELVRERALTSAGGAPENPGRIGEIRRTIARVKTIQHELNEI
ncbi:MAG TPA: 50S ribosomal protein L29 [Methanosarcina sp.]|jgi:large subunit ribosomal protein L29